MKIDTKEHVADLISKLEEATKLKKNGRCLKSTHSLPIAHEPVQSWKFNEWDYGKEQKIQLPCNARGLFTIGNRIVVRGYDKFFNVNEIPATKTQTLKSKTQPSYDLSLKENGCIIFISGLANGELIVCSKHSVGARDDLTRNHAVQGELEINKQLKRLGKSTKDLAIQLYESNLTAVAELCDDDFEEHVLEYSKENSGLYLHGLNYNTIKFQTCPIPEVNDFANNWGFKKIDSFQISGWGKLWDFLNQCAISGTYQNREIEGFVIRTKLNGTNDDFFFKFKFEEPYLLYRQFREVTKKYIRDANILKIIQGIKKHKFITLKYLEFIRDYFNKYPELKDDYLKGFGIIKMRKLFLKENNLSETSGMDLIGIDKKQSQNVDETKKLEEKLASLSLNSIKTYKYILIPIATIGCGKTTTFQTLTNCFPDWKHVQNDNIGSGKQAKIQLVDQTLIYLEDKDCKLVFCDRNNHQFRERDQLLKDFDKHRINHLSSDIGLKYVAINFIKKDLTEDQLWNITYDRIVKRGDNHQSIKSSTDSKLAQLIMKGFIKRLQPLNTERHPDCEFDLVIDMDIDDNSSKSNATKILNKLSSEFPDLFDKQNLPSSDKIDEAFQKALEYKPVFTKTFGRSSAQASSKKTDSNQKKKKKSIAYYGIGINDTQKFKHLINDKLVNNETWIQLCKQDRLQPNYHVTLSHILSVKDDEKLKIKWDQLTDQLQIKPDQLNDECDAVPVKFFGDIGLKRIVVVSHKLVTVEAELVRSLNGNFEELDQFPYTNKYLHVTLGTTEPEIKPFLSNVYIEELHNSLSKESIEDGIYTVKEDTVEVINFNTILEKQQCFYHF